MSTPDDIERINKEMYEKNYSLEQLSLQRNASGDDYFEKMVELRLDLINLYGQNKTVLDVACGTGDYLFESRGFIQHGFGIDYQKNAIDAAQQKVKLKEASNLEFIYADAKEIPLKSETIDLVYSFSALYFVPRVDMVIEQVSRVLKPKGIAILELGNLFSLNTFVARAHSETALPCHISVGEMKRIVKDSGLKIIRRRSFQILPLWGEKPGWLKPLLHPRWREWLQQDNGDTMLDERISSLPILRNLSFRQMLICQKG